jgi:hypothetical protein
VLHFQRLNARRYFDVAVAGFPGRTLGVDAPDGSQETAGS